jgi:hypothetical protein
MAIQTGLNFNRNYRFTFFEVSGTGPYTVRDIPGIEIKNSVNFSFSYSVSNNIQNTAKFQFYNISKDTINFFIGSNTRRGFRFETWYGDPSNQGYPIFKGLTCFVNTYRVGPDIITEVEAGDVFLNLIGKGIVQSFPVGTSNLAAVKSLLNAYGSIAVLDVNSYQYLKKVYKTPKIFRGQLIPILKSIAADADLIFNLHLGVISMIPKSLQTQTASSVMRISKDTGLIGYPRAESLSLQLFPVTYFDNLQLNQNLAIIGLSTLLQPYRLYDKVYVDTEYFKGYYGVLSLTQAGEWRSSSWMSTLKLWPDSSK